MPAGTPGDDVSPNWTTSCEYPAALFLRRSRRIWEKIFASPAEFAIVANPPLFVVAEMEPHPYPNSYLARRIRRDSKSEMSPQPLATSDPVLGQLHVSQVSPQRIKRRPLEAAELFDPSYYAPPAVSMIPLWDAAQFGMPAERTRRQQIRPTSMQVIAQLTSWLDTETLHSWDAQQITPYRPVARRQSAPSDPPPTLPYAAFEPDIFVGCGIQALDLPRRSARRPVAQIATPLPFADTDPAAIIAWVVQQRVPLFPRRQGTQPGEVQPLATQLVDTYVLGPWNAPASVPVRTPRRAAAEQPVPAPMLAQDDGAVRVVFFTQEPGPGRFRSAGRVHVSAMPSQFEIPERSVPGLILTIGPFYTSQAGIFVAGAWAAIIQEE